MYEYNVRLYRDSLTTPWGIRLEGGKDFAKPLVIQRVFAGSPASGELQRGDVILFVQNHNASHLSHQEANEIIKNSGGSISFTIRRGLNYVVPMSSSLRPHQMAANYGPPKHAMTHAVNYAPYTPSHLYEAEDPLQSYVRSRPIEKVKNPKPILSQTGSPIMPGDTPSMGGLRVQTMKRFRPASTLPMLGASSSNVYSSPSYYDDMSYTPTSPSQQFTFAQPHHQPASYASQPLSYPYTNNMNSVAVPFNERRMASQLQHSVTRAAANKYNAPAYHHQPQQQQHHHHHQHHHQAPSTYPFSPSAIQGNQHNYQPQQQQQQYSAPWSGSLQPSSPSIRVGGASQASPKSPKVVNLQYNTPIGLYSKDNIREELHRQIGNTNLPFVPSSEF